MTIIEYIHNLGDQRDSMIVQSCAEYSSRGFGDTAVTKDKKPPFFLPDKIPQGSRNDTIFRLASKLQQAGLKDSEILETCQIVNKTRCNPPMAEEEVTQIANQALKYEKGNTLPDKPQRMEYALQNITNQVFVSRYQLYLPEREQLEAEYRRFLDKANEDINDNTKSSDTV